MSPPELAQSRRLEVDTGKWLLSKLAARRYGDRIEVKNEVSGPIGQPIAVQTQVLLENPVVMDPLSDVQVEAIRSAALALALLLLACRRAILVAAQVRFWTCPFDTPAED
jgi:hypothetical protein